jgi:hypothetical protein
MTETDRFSQERKDIEWIPIEQLKLDIRNPRLTSTIADSTLTQDDMVKLLWRVMDVMEIALSIAVNGYFPGEPLFVIPEENHNSPQVYLVVEGNRRLAAVKLITDPKLRKEVGAAELDREITAELVESLRILPVIIYQTREELWKYLGFRHINGPKPWDAFSKAQYVAQVHDEYGIPLDEIARMIGDRHATVQRLYRGYETLVQAETQTGFNREDRFRNRFFFSHLYTALDQPQFQEFLGMERENSLQANPVPESHLKELEELMVWLYGKKSDGLEPVIKQQNPDLNILREIISKQESLVIFRSLAAKGSPFALTRAHEVAVGDERRFSDALIMAKDQLQQASATVSTGYQGRKELFDIAEDIYKTASGLRRTMRTILDRRRGRA